MANSFPADVQKAVSDMLASGRYESADAVLREAIQLLKQRDALKREIDTALAELDRGEGIAAQSVFQELREKAAALGIPDA